MLVDLWRDKPQQVVCQDARYSHIKVPATSYGLVSTSVPGGIQLIDGAACTVGWCTSLSTKAITIRTA